MIQHYLKQPSRKPLDESTSNEMEVSIEKYKASSAVSNMQTAEMNLPNWLKNSLQKITFLLLHVLRS